MRKVFWENPYKHSLTTRVAVIEGNQILFDETIAYSFSGGQESDKAYVNDMAILDSKIADNHIYYTIPEEHGLKVGDTVTMEIDWARRYKLMRLHFAAELILEITTKQLGLEKIGAHISETKARIDFNSDKNIASFLEAILSEYNDIINQDKPIITGYSDIETQERYWEIEGFARVPCGGTHVRSTAEVGFVTLKRVNIGRGKERIEILLI